MPLPTRSSLRFAALLACALSQGGLAHAQSAQALALQISPRLKEDIDQVQRNLAPTFVSGDQMSVQQAGEMKLQGHAELRRSDLMIRADELSFDESQDLAQAQGQVHMNQSGSVFEGPTLQLHIDSFEGFIDRARYYLLYNDGYGQSRRLDFLDSSRMVVHDTTFSTCKPVPGADWMPAWLMRATTLSFDTEEKTAVADDVTIDFQQVPILHLPGMEFPISGQRQTGMLAPTLGSNNVSGQVVTTPYYWNIAPNRDLTLYPTVMTARGVNLGTDFRYLEQKYSGQWRLDMMPQDNLRGMDRWGASIQHTQTETTPIGGLGLIMSLNRVSDDNYWKDFPNSSPALTQRLLANDINLNLTQGPTVYTLRTQTWQTLQDPLSPIVPPYDRAPQLNVRYTQPYFNGLDVKLESDLTNFQSNAVLTGQPNAQRAVATGQISYPMLSGAGYFTPKVAFNTAAYQFDAALSNGQTQASRTVPTVSLDTGLVFERDTTFFDSAYRQTLEPRLFYVNTPYVNQNYLPNYDTGLMDFSFASIYSENPFIGNDRIADNNLLTAGVTSRMLDGNSGAEIMRLNFAQRLRFQDQQTTLPGGTPEKAGVSDFLVGAGLNLDPHWYFDSTAQFNPTTNTSSRSTYMFRYNPTPYRVLNLAYRYQQAASEQLDVAWQWPLNDLWGDRGKDLGAGRGEGAGRWYSVARLNYSMRDAQMVDSTLGIEYDAGCWLGRLVFQTLSTGLATSTQTLMFQLEFVGFSRLGIDPTQSLRTGIPGYQLLRGQVSPASRFSNYD